MLFELMLALSMGTLALFVLLAWVVSVKYKGARGLLRPLNVIIVGVFIAGALLYIPVYYSDRSISLVEIMMNTVHDVLQLFTVDSDIGVIYEGIVGLENHTLRMVYSTWFSVLYGLTPILTFGFLLSFFKNFASYRRYTFHFFSDVYIFSELNERSLAFAENILKTAKEKRAQARALTLERFLGEGNDTKAAKKERKKVRNGMIRAARAAVVFLGVDDEDEKFAGIADRARALGAIIFTKDIISAKLGFHSKKAQFSLFMISENESENVDLSIGLLTVYGKRPNSHIYVFSDSAESELLLNHAEREKTLTKRQKARKEKKKARLAAKEEKKAAALAEKKKRLSPKALAKLEEELANKAKKEAEKVASCYTKVKRVNVIRALINHTLYETGTKAVFHKDWLPEDPKDEEAAARRALAVEDGEKVISAVVIGMGLHGTEMVKGLAWYGQMIGYRLYINAFDSDEKARSRFAARCPELMCEKYNGPKAERPFEESYRIDVHQADVFSEEFVKKLKTLPKVSYVMVCLGNDELNLEVAVRMRSLCASFGWEPYIQAIRYNTGENEDFSHAKNFRNQRYDIDLVGDMKSIYSEKVILYSALEEKALKRHCLWGNEEDFWKFEYNYNSSIASALHHDLKIELGLPGANLPPKERTEADRDAIRRLEHRRWDAYMRSEGYSFAEKRNDLAKQHPCLVYYDQLPLKEQLKDDD